MTTQKTKRKTWTRLRVVLVTLSLTLMGVAGTVTMATPASATVYGDDYPTVWRNAPQDTIVDSWKEWNRECTSFVAWRLSSRSNFAMPFNDNAGLWKGDALARGYVVDNTPAVGSVAWDSGHVAWVAEVNSGNVTLEEYNWLVNGVPDGAYHTRTVATASYQYIHFADIVTTNTSQWQWYLRNENSAGGAYTSFTYGAVATDHPITGDWDGNGSFTPGIVRGDNGQWQWHLRNDNSNGGAYTSFDFGLATDIPIVGDWDGNGTYTPGVVRNVNGEWVWYLRNDNSAGGAYISLSFGSASTDDPVVGDWTGDGISKPGLARNQGGNWQWYLRNNDTETGGAYVSFSYGAVATDHPVAGSWAGGHVATPGLVRNVNGEWTWFLRNNNDPSGGAYTSFGYGAASTDMPIVGDWDGNGTMTPGVVRASS